MMLHLSSIHSRERERLDFYKTGDNEAQRKQALNIEMLARDLMYDLKHFHVLYIYWLIVKCIPSKYRNILHKMGIKSAPYITECFTNFFNHVFWFLKKLDSWLLHESWISKPIGVSSLELVKIFL